MPKFNVTGPDGKTYSVNAPEWATKEDAIAYVAETYYGGGKTPTKPQAAPPAAAPKPAAPTAAPQAGGTLEQAPLKDPGGFAKPWEYLTNREAAIKQDRAQRAYLQDRMQRENLKDLQTQTGFFDRLGDMFDRGELSVQAGIKDIEAAIERDPVLKKQYQAEARRFAADVNTPISGETTWEAVKKDPIKVLPFVLEQGAASIPQMVMGRLSPLGLALSTLGTAGGVARSRAESDERQDVSGLDALVALPVGVISAALDQFGLGEIIGTAGKNAVIRTLKAAGAEGGTEAIQNTLEYLGGAIGTKHGANARDAFDQAMAGLVAGGGMGAGLRGTGELVTAPFRKRAEAAAGNAPNPEIRAEFQRLAAQEVGNVMQQNPGMTREDAVAQVETRAEDLLTRAKANILGAGEEDIDVDTGMDVSGAGGEGIAPDLEPGAAPIGAAGIGAVDTGRLGKPVSGVSVSDVGAGAGIPALDLTDFAPAIAAVQEAPDNKTRKAAATQLVSDVVQAVPEFQALGPKKYSQAANQIVLAAARGADFDPVAIVAGVAPKPKAAPSVVEAAKAAPAITAEEQIAPTPVAGEVTPQPEAQLAPEPQVAPTVAETATAEKVTPPAERTMNDLAGMGAVNPENTNEVLVQGGGIQLTPVNENTLQLDSLRAVEKGGGRKAMAQLTQVADSNGAAIQLSPEPFTAEAGKQMSPTELTEWYKGFGFQEQPDGSMVRPATTPATSIMPQPEYTPQQIAENLDSFAMSEAQDRGLDPGMFREGVRDIRAGREPLSDQQILDAQGPEYLDAYKAGQQWAQERIAEAQAAPAKAAAKPAAKRAPTKVKAKGATQKANGKAIKKVISSKPGKTAAEKVMHIAQTAFDETPKADIIEQVTPYDPEYETIRAKPGMNVERMANMVGWQIYGDPTNMGQVCIKEVLQNSFDATRTAINDGQIEQGKIDVTVSDDGRTLTVKDNGIGMSPELLGGKFLEIAGTAKEGDKNAGGFGIAKMLFLYANKDIRVVTARDGRIAEMNVTGEQLFKSLNDPENAPDIEIRDLEPVDYMAFPDGHGTIIQLTLHEQIKGGGKTFDIKELPRWLDNAPSLQLSPLFSNIAVTFQGRSYMGTEDVPTGSNFPIQDYTQFTAVKFPWGTAKVYITREQTGQTYGENMHILSNGLWQFSTKVSKDPTDAWSGPVPYNFYVDIVPAVKPDEYGYPFDFNRQGFTDEAKRDFSKVKNYIDAIYAYKSRAGEATSFGSVQYFDANGQLGPVIDLTPDIPVVDTAFTRIAEGDQITLSDDGSLLVNGQPMPELTPDQLKAGIPSANELTVNPDLIDTNSVMVHDNTDVTIVSTGEKMSIPDFMRRQFGERFDDFMRFNGDTFLTLRNEVARVMGYSKLRDEAIGVSFDPEYRGVSIRLPFSGSFINPLVPKYADGLRAGYGIFGTMIHELAHHKVRSHNANFPAEMQDILLNMEADEGFGYQRFKDNFADTIAEKYGDIVQLGVELFNGTNNEVKIEYRGNRFTEGSGESAPEGTGDGGTGNVRGPSGAGSTGESLLGPAYERTRGAGAGRNAGRGAEGGTEPLTPANVDKAVSVKLTKGQIKRLEQAAGLHRMELNRMQRRIVQSRNTKETNSLLSRLAQAARGPNEDRGLLASLAKSFSPKVYKFLLGFQQIDNVFWLARSAGIKALDKIDTMMREGYVPYVNRIVMSADKISREWTEFASRDEAGNAALNDAIMISNMMNVDPSAAPNAAAYMKIDEDLRLLQDKLAAEKDPKKKSSLQGQISKRKSDIQRVYFGGQDVDENGNTIQVDGWNHVPPEGRRIFKAARDFYRASFKEHYRLLMQRIDDAQFDEADASRMKQSIANMFAKADERVIYFPVKRFGEYWLSVGGDFYMRETTKELDQLKRELKAAGETRDISTGEKSGLRGLRNAVANKDASSALKDILDILDGSNTSDISGQHKINDAEDLKDLIFQMYLTALPEADMRRRFIHRQFKTGFSTDALRTFASTAVASANQLGRLAYNYKFQAELENAKEETEGKDLKPWLDQFTAEIRDRVDNIMTPDPHSTLDTLLAYGAKLTFLHHLSSPASAFINLTQLHIVGAPVLAGEFGEAKTTAMMGRYITSFLAGREIPNPFRDDEGNVRVKAPEFKFENSAYMRSLKKSDPERYKQTVAAWKYGNERDIIETTFSAGADLYERGNSPTGDYNFRQAARRGEVVTAAKRAAANTMDAMGYLFHTTEKVGRSVMYMSTFDLAYERAIKQGKSPAEAGKEARELAVKLTNKAMFDFSNWNKPRFAKHPAGRLALQMTQYMHAMNSLLFRSFIGMLPYYNKEGKAAAARVFFGTAAVTALYGGLRATQMYAWGMGAYTVMKWIADALTDDDDEEADKEGEQGYLNENTIERELLKYADEKGNELGLKDMQYYIRTQWIPEVFGPDGTMAKALGLSDETAAKLSSAADMGIPAAFGVDISNSVSLGDLWHPVQTKGNTPEVRFFEGLARIMLGPFGGTLSSYYKAYQSANEGDIDGTIESLLPAAFRNYFKAQRLKEEGLMIGKDKDIQLKDPAYYTPAKVILQSMGLRDAETSRDMQLDIMAGDIEKDVAQEKTKLLDKRYRAILAYEKDPSADNEKAWNRVERAIDVYNLNYPSNAISEKAVGRSYEEKARDARMKGQGLGINPKIPVREPLQEERLKRLDEGQ